MAKLTPKQWGEAKILFELGNTLQYIADKTGIDQSSVSKKAKANSWIKGGIKEIQDKKSNAIKDLAIVNQEIQEKFNPLEIKVINRESDLSAQVKIQGYGLQLGIMELTELARSQVKEIMLKAPDGLYVKSESANGTVYGRTTEFLRDIASSMPAVNTLLGLDKSTDVTTNIQNNLTPQIKIVRKE